MDCKAIRPFDTVVNFYEDFHSNSSNPESNLINQTVPSVTAQSSSSHNPRCLIRTKSLKPLSNSKPRGASLNSFSRSHDLNSINSVPVHRKIRCSSSNEQLESHIHTSYYSPNYHSQTPKSMFFSYSPPEKEITVVQPEQKSTDVHVLSDFSNPQTYITFETHPKALLSVACNKSNDSNEAHKVSDLETKPPECLNAHTPKTDISSENKSNLEHTEHILAQNSITSGVQLPSKAILMHENSDKTSEALGNERNDSSSSYLKWKVGTYQLTAQTKDNGQETNTIQEELTLTKNEEQRFRARLKELAKSRSLKEDVVASLKKKLAESCAEYEALKWMYSQSLDRQADLEQEVNGFKRSRDWYAGQLRVAQSGREKVQAETERLHKMLRESNEINHRLSHENACLQAQLACTNASLAKANRNISRELETVKMDMLEREAVFERIFSERTSYEAVCRQRAIEINELQTQICNLQAQLLSRDQQLGEQKSKFLDAQAAFAAVDNRRKDLQEKLDLLENQHVTKVNQLEEQIRSHSILLLRMETLDVECRSKDVQLNETLEEKATLLAALDAAQKEKNTLNDYLMKLQSNLARVEESFERLRYELDDKCVQVFELTNQRDSLNNHIKVLQSQILNVTNPYEVSVSQKQNTDHISDLFQSKNLPEKVDFGVQVVSDGSLFQHSKSDNIIHSEIEFKSKDLGGVLASDLTSSLVGISESDAQNNRNHHVLQSFDYQPHESCLGHSKQSKNTSTQTDDSCIINLKKFTEGYALINDSNSFRITSSETTDSDKISHVPRSHYVALEQSGTEVSTTIPSLEFPVYWSSNQYNSQNLPMLNGSKDLYEPTNFNPTNMEISQFYNVRESCQNVNAQPSGDSQYDHFVLPHQVAVVNSEVGFCAKSDIHNDVVKSEVHDSNSKPIYTERINTKEDCKIFIGDYTQHDVVSHNISVPLNESNTSDEMRQSELLMKELNVVGNKSSECITIYQSNKSFEIDNPKESTKYDISDYFRNMGVESTNSEFDLHDKIETQKNREVGLQTALPVGHEVNQKSVATCFSEDELEASVSYKSTLDSMLSSLLEDLKRVQSERDLLTEAFAKATQEACETASSLSLLQKEFEAKSVIAEREKIAHEQAVHDHQCTLIELKSLRLRFEELESQIEGLHQEAQKARAECDFLRDHQDNTSSAHTTELEALKSIIKTTTEHLSNVSKSLKEVQTEKTVYQSELATLKGAVRAHLESFRSSGRIDLAKSNLSNETNNELEKLLGESASIPLNQSKPLLALNKCFETLQTEILQLDEQVVQYALAVHDTVNSWRFSNSPTSTRKFCESKLSTKE